MIPKIIHKTGPFNNINSLPECLKDIFNHNKKLNKNYSFRYYNDADATTIIKYFDKDVYEAYNSIIPKAFKMDIFRMVILYLYGGIYSDLSQKFNVSLSKIINHDKDKLIICQNMEICFMASYPKNELFKFILDYQINNIKNRDYGECKTDITGPVAVRKAFNIYFNKNIKNDIKLGNYDDNINVLLKIKYMDNIFNKLIDSIRREKRYKMYLVDINNKRLIKMYCRNHKKLLYNETHIPHYGELYNKRRVFIDGNPDFKKLFILILSVGLFIVSCIIKNT